MRHQTWKITNHTKISSFHSIVTLNLKTNTMQEHNLNFPSHSSSLVLVIYSELKLYTNGIWKMVTGLIPLMHTWKRTSLHDEVLTYGSNMFHILLWIISSNRNVTGLNSKRGMPIIEHLWNLHTHSLFASLARLVSKHPHTYRASWNTST